MWVAALLEGEGGGRIGGLAIGRGQQTQASEWHGSEVGVSVVERYSEQADTRVLGLLTLLFQVRRWAPPGWEFNNLIAVEKYNKGPSVRYSTTG